MMYKPTQRDIVLKDFQVFNLYIIYDYEKKKQIIEQTFQTNFNLSKGLRIACSWLNIALKTKEVFEK